MAAPALRAQTSGPLTLEGLLTEMTDRSAVARFPSPAYTCKQFSSYDPASTSSDNRATWFANGDQGHYLRVEQVGDRKEYVMAEMAGPGAIVRVWSPDPKGTLRVYLDGAKAPVIEATRAGPVDPLARMCFAGLVWRTRMEIQSGSSCTAAWPGS